MRRMGQCSFLPRLTAARFFEDDRGNGRGRSSDWGEVSPKGEDSAEWGDLRGRDGRPLQRRVSSAATTV